MRKLASIQKIEAINPIEGRDRIVEATVLGWRVLIRKDEYQVGDLTIFCEIDSVLPERQEFEFLRDKKFRVKTFKLSNCISQGICFSLSLLPDKDWQVGEDVTEVLGVTKYEPDENNREPQVEKEHEKKWYAPLLRFRWFRRLVLPKKQWGGFPSFISKTDETRLMNMPFLLKDKSEWVVSEKIDGSSITIFLKRERGRFGKVKFDYGVCSRNLRLNLSDVTPFTVVAEKYNTKQVLMDSIEDYDFIAIQGEQISAKTQANKYKVTEPDMYVFNVITPEGRMGSLEAKEWCEARGLKFVPIVSESYVLPDTMQEVIDYSHGKSKLYDTLREGLVFRSMDGKRSFKVVDPKWLLKHGL